MEWLAFIFTLIQHRNTWHGDLSEELSRLRCPALPSRHLIPLIDVGHLLNLHGTTHRAWVLGCVKEEEVDRVASSHALILRAQL